MGHGHLRIRRHGHLSDLRHTDPRSQQYGPCLFDAAGVVALGSCCSAGVAALNRGARAPAAVLAAALPAVAILLLAADGLAAERAGWLAEAREAVSWVGALR